jgi:hypothetical protein
LHDYILESGVHPMTSLETMPKKVKEYFVEKKIVTVKQIAHNNFQVLQDCHFLSNDEIARIKDEVNTYFHDKLN